MKKNLLITCILLITPIFFLPSCNKENDTYEYEDIPKEQIARQGPDENFIDDNGQMPDGGGGGGSSTPTRFYNGTTFTEKVSFSAGSFIVTYNKEIKNFPIVTDMKGTEATTTKNELISYSIKNEKFDSLNNLESFTIYVTYIIYTRSRIIGGGYSEWLPAMTEVYTLNFEKKDI